MIIDKVVYFVVGAFFYGLLSISFEPLEAFEYVFILGVIKEIYDFVFKTHDKADIYQLLSFILFGFLDLVRTYI